MVAVMEGIRIVEVAEHTFVPAASAILADWGADVVKIEHVERGDAMRGLASTGVINFGSGVHVILEHSNRGKRSIGLDLAREEGRQICYDLVARADVFITNKPPAVLQKLGIDPESIRKANAGVIYARGSAYGPKGPDAGKGGYDATGFWARGGSAMGAMYQGSKRVPPQPAPAYGDSIGAITIAGGIAAALLHRARTGEATIVDVSLLGTGVWAMAAAVGLSAQLNMAWRPPGSGDGSGAENAGESPEGAPVGGTGVPGTGGERGSSGSSGGTGGFRNPLTGNFRTRDDRWITFTMLQAAKYWPAVAEAIGQPELASDARFATHAALAENHEIAGSILRQAIAGRTLSEWKERLAEFPGQWAPVQDSLEVLSDPQVRANGYIGEAVTAGGVPFKLVTTPVQFDETPTPPKRAPEFNEHGDAILTEDLGLSWDRVIELKTKGVVA